MSVLKTLNEMMDKESIKISDAEFMREKSIFHELGLRDGEATILQFKSELLIKIKEIAKKKGLKRRDLEKIFDVPQPRVSDLMTGKIDRFSIEILILFLIHLGAKVSPSIKLA